MTGAGHVLDLSVERQDEYSRFLPLVKWLLAIPHFVAVGFVAIGAAFVTIFAFFAVLLTGRYPRGAWNYMLGLHRWMTRLNAYVLLMSDRYPPFSLGEEPDFPARVELAYPEQMERWRPLVAWLLIFPYVLVGSVINFIAAVCVVLAFFAILLTKNFPESLFRFVVGATRWNRRALAYGHFVATKYPPFSLS